MPLSSGPSCALIGVKPSPIIAPPKMRGLMPISFDARIRPTESGG
jgi:hypothetical protein